VKPAHRRVIAQSSVKTTESGGRSGYDGGQKVKGRSVLVTERRSLVGAEVHPRCP